MAEAGENHAWLYQYNAPAAGTAWLERLKHGERVDWRITRWASETRVGDLVLFWETGKRGGFRGWGRVVDELYSQAADGNRTVWRVPVAAEIWLIGPIRRQQVLESEPFLPTNLYLKISQGANFPLEPEEATRLLALLPDDSWNDMLGEVRLALHPASVPSALQRAAVQLSALQLEVEEVDGDEAFTGDDDGGAPSDNAQDDDAGPLLLDPSFFSQGVSPAASRILNDADFGSLGVLGPISTTRLFLAIFDINRPTRTDGTSPAELGALTAARGVASSFRQPIQDLLKGYLERQRRGLSSESFPEVTPNVRRLLSRARGLSLSKGNARDLTADGIIAALLTTPGGAFANRLAEVELPLDVVKRRMLEMIATLRGDLLPYWQEVLGMELGPHGTAPTPVPQPRTLVPHLGNDNAWKRGQADALGADHEARAFAALALSASTVPPLAVGVFGDWGSGKSFFMRLVYEHIEQLSQDAREQQQEQRQQGKGTLLGDVVQIRFNAWHYVDTNLWASLVDHIFTELDKATSKDKPALNDKLFDQLTTARELTLESAQQLVQRRQEQQEASRAAAAAQEKLALAQSLVGNSPKLYWEAFKAEFWDKLDSGEGKALKDAAAGLGIPKLVDDGKVLADTLHRLQAQRGRAGVVAAGLGSRLGSWTSAALFLGTLVAVPLLFWALRELAGSMAPSLKEAWGQAVVTASSLVTAVTAVFAVAGRQVKRALDALESLRGKYDAAAAKALEVPAQQAKAQQEEVARLTAEVEERRARLAASTEKLTEAAREYNAGTGKGRLLSFVRARAAGKEYSKHLGLVATIRKDFEELSELIAGATQPDARATEQASEIEKNRAAYKARVEALIQQADAAATPLLREEEKQKLLDTSAGKAPAELASLSRIVLYIDDLDRCQPDKVAEVMQAVHLLLSFELFVVFVAVDVRWVTRALRVSYPALLVDTAQGGAATAHDYLEKIFQVPYWVRPMTDESAAGFVNKRLERLAAERVAAAAQAPGQPAPVDAPAPPPLQGGQGMPAGPAAPPAPAEGGTPKAATPAPADEEEVVEDERKGEGEGEGEGKGKGEGGEKDGGQAGTASAPPIPHLDLDDAERAFMAQLAPWAGNSPRRLLRFLNVYQVMKASLVAGGVAPGEGFHGLMAQVAIVTGAPDLFEPWFDALTAKVDSPSLEAARARVAAPRTTPARAQHRNLAGALDVLARAQAQPDVARLGDYALLTRRYSFGSDPAGETGDPAAWR